MSFASKRWIEGYIFALSEEKYSYSIIKKRCEKHGFNISTRKISDIINGKGKKRQNLYLTGEKGKNAYPTKVRTSSIISKVASHVLKENPTTQRTIAKSLNISVSTVNKIINCDLKLIKRKKT